MYHVLTITYEAKNLFNGQKTVYRRAFRLSWEGVKNVLANPFYRDRGAAFRLSPYMGQAVDN